MNELDQSSILMDISNRIHAKLGDILLDLELTDELADVLVASAAFSSYLLNRPERDPNECVTAGMTSGLARATLSLGAATLLMARQKLQQRLQQIYGLERTHEFLDSFRVPPPAEVTLEMLQDLTKDWSYAPTPMNDGQTIH